MTKDRRWDGARGDPGWGRLRDAIAAELREIPGALTPQQLEEVLTWLAQDSVPQPPPGMAEELLKRLEGTMPARPRRSLGQRRAGRGRVGTASRPGAVGLLAVLRPQVRWLGRSFWFGSAGVAAALLLVTMARQSLPLFVWLAPLLAVAGVALAFRGAGTGLAEAERACPVDPLALVLGRFLWVALYDGVLLGLVTLALPLVGPAAREGVSVAALMLAWLAPFLFFGSVALVLTLRWGGVAGPAAAMILWAAVLWPQLSPASLGGELLAALLAPPGAAGWWQGRVLLLAVTVAVWAYLILRRPGLRSPWLYLPQG